MQKTRGSVSIFLVIILVPVLVVTSLFVDASRIELVKALTASSADLTLNTVLTQYDSALNESYGLLASSQNIEEFLANAEEYFEACMVSQGVSTTDAGRYADEIGKLINGEGEIADFLAVDLGQTDASVSSMKDADLANAALVKNEVVEFMKYRSPMNTITGFIDKMKSVDEDLKDKSKEAKLTDKKNKFYEAEHELLKKALEIYLLCLKYNEMGMTKAYMEEIETYVNTLEKTYQELHRKSVKDWNNTGGELGQKKFGSVGTQVSTNPSPRTQYTSSNSAPHSDVKGNITRCTTKRGQYEAAKTALLNAMSNAGIDLVYKAGNYDIQYWIQTAEAISKGNVYENFIKASNAMFVSYANMKTTYENRITTKEEKEEYTEEKTTTGADGKTKTTKEKKTRTKTVDVPLDGAIQSAYNSEMSAMSGVISDFNSQQIHTISKKLEEISTEAIDSKATNRAEATKQIKAVAEKLQEYYDKIEAADELVEKIGKELEGLRKLARKYDESFRAWEGYADQFSAQRPDNDMVQEDVEEINKLKNPEGKDGTDVTVLDKMDAYINEASVDEMVKRCSNIRSLFGSFTKGIERYQYGGTQVMKITSYDKLEASYRLEKTRITIVDQELEAYIAETWAIPVFTKPAPGDIHKVTDNNHPEFEVSKPQLYEWLMEKFRNYDEANDQNGKKQYEDLKDQMEDEEKKQEEEQDKNKPVHSKKEIKGQPELPSGGRGEDGGPGGSAQGKGESGEKLQGAADDTDAIANKPVFDIVAGFKTLRDNLYVTDYIMSMFSYDTYEYEGKYELLREGKESEDVYEVAGDTISPLNAKTLYGSKDIVDKWTSKSRIYTANKTLTNKMINLENNLSYGNEAEYVLYGGNNAGNKVKSYATIYSLRYAINIAPVFGQYWNDKMLVIPISTAISAATCGVIPQSLVKLIICLGITAAETAVDVSYLMSGLPVLFIKKKEDLFLSLEGIKDGANSKITGFSSSTERKKDSSRPYFSYSEYLSLFLMIGTLAKPDHIYLRTADVIQCNMRLKEGSGDFLMREAKVYFDIEANVKVKPLMLGIPFIREEGASVLDSSSWNSFTFTGTRGY